MAYAQLWHSVIPDKDGFMACTIYDIAKKCNCSTTTVSKVLNNSGNISPSKAKEILEAAQELGYVRSHSAMSLASSSKSSKLIGVYLHINEDRSISHELFSRIMNSFRKEVEKKGFDLCFIRNMDDKEKYGYDELLFSRGIDGVLVLSDNNYSDKFSNFILNSKVPTVTFDIARSKYMVSSNNVESVATLVDYLSSKGHKRICYVYPEEAGVSEQRKEGFLLGLKRNNIPFDKRMLVYGPYYGEESAKIATDNALKSGINPTVIMYPDDYTAIAAIPYLRSLGYHVPGDISVTGFDGVEIATVMRPSIVTIKQDSDSLGSKAAELLLSLIGKEEIKEKHITIPTTLFKGESVKFIE